MSEKWKDIDGFVGRYQISNNGKVKSLFNANGEYRELIIAGSLDKNGYHRVNLYKNNAVTYKRTNILVAEYFLDKPGEEYQVNHKDGNKLNNHVSNLEWVTCRENIIHSVRTGLRKPRFGEDHSRSILSEKDVIKIYKSEEYQYIIAKKYNITQAVVSNIKNRKSWKHITASLELDPGTTNRSLWNSKLSINQVVKIFLSKIPQRVLAKKYNVSKSLIGSIKTKKVWSSVTNSL